MNTNDAYGIKVVKIKHFHFQPIIGFGYWRDLYLKDKSGYDGVSHNLIIPFCRFQWGHLESTPTIKLSDFSGKHTGNIETAKTCLK